MFYDDLTKFYFRCVSSDGKTASQG